MPVVAVINRKGGSGKSTLATHLAGHCAQAGLRVMLGDVDRQQSSLAWLKRRSAQAQAAPIVGWAVDPRSVMRPPSGITHVVLDTPGGMRGSDLARTAMYADAVLMPVCHSAFDRESAAECFAELQTLPRVSSGRCQVALVGMRLDARTKAAAELRDWAEHQQLPYVGALRETQTYVRLVEQGLTLFDLPAAKVEADLLQWQPVLDWLHGAWREAALADRVARVADRPLDLPAERPRRVEPETPRRHAAVPALSTHRAAPGPLGWLAGMFRSST